MDGLSFKVDEWIQGRSVSVAEREREREMSGQLCVKNVHGDVVRCKKIDAARHQYPDVLEY